MQIDIVCENTVGRPIAACGEHGFACLIETGSGRWLFDTGSGETLLKNLEVLGLDTRGLNGVILSHGHYDHCGGLLPLVKAVGPLKTYAHANIFKQRFWQGLHEVREISVPYRQEALEKAGVEFVFLDGLTELDEGFYFSGPLPRNSRHETGDPNLFEQGADGELSGDRFEDDAALALMTAKGLVIVLGCAHAGLINTVEHFRQELGEEKIHAIVGGTHLGPASDAQYAATADYLAELNPDRIGVSHCTGQIRSAQLFARFPNKVFFANVGTSLKV